MIVCKQDKDGYWWPVRGNPTLLRLDGKAKAPLRVVLHHSWTWEQRWAYGIHELEHTPIPEGHHAVHTTYRLDKDGKVREEHVIEKDPDPEPFPSGTSRIEGRAGPGRRQRREEPAPASE